MKASNIHFEMAERGRALNYGGIGAIHLMGQRLGLAEEIDSRLELLKRHLPYHESDTCLIWLTMPCSMASGWRIPSCVAMMKRSWMVWEPNTFLIRPPLEILHDALMKSLFWSSWKPSTHTGGVSRRSNLEDFLQQAFKDTDRTRPGRWESAKGEWLFPIKESGVACL